MTVVSANINDVATPALHNQASNSDESYPPIDTVQELESLCAHWPGPLSTTGRAALKALCQEIAVRRTVLAAYDSGWKKPTHRETLPPAYWPLLITTLLAYACESCSTYEHPRALSFKNLNAAFSALDLAEGLGGVPHLPALRARAIDILEAAVWGTDQ